MIDQTPEHCQMGPAPLLVQVQGPPLTLPAG
jgi:hypothetical protein